jgi:hypothetical protein
MAGAFVNKFLESTPLNTGVEKQASGRQSRRAAFWKAQHIHNM